MSTSIRKEADKVPEPTLRRLPWYLSNIKLMKEKGEQYVSSTQISKEINIDASQIAKDLSYVNISGRTRVGYNIDALIEVLESFLGFTNMHKAFLFGVGSLGAALLRDSGLHHFGLEIVVAAFFRCSCLSEVAIGALRWLGPSVSVRLWFWAVAPPSWSRRSQWAGWWGGGVGG